MFFKRTFLVPFVFHAAGAYAETHTVLFTNLCVGGTPTLVQAGNILHSGHGSYTTAGPLVNFIAYLQTAGCGLNGESCTIVEGTLTNSGPGSSVDISLIPPHAFSVTTSFGYYGANESCDGIGLDCTAPNCPCAYRIAADGCQFPCPAPDINLAISFCD